MRQLTCVFALLRAGLPRNVLGAAVLSTTLLGGGASAADAVAPTIVAGESAGVSQSQALGEGRFKSIDSALARYRDLTLEYRWPPIVTTATLRLGDSDAVVADIRNRLILLGDLPASTAPSEPWLFDEALQLALMQFQRRHGLAADGVWGRRSRAALEVSPGLRYRQLLLNRERLAQFEAQRGAENTYVVVNIPAFEMRYFESGQPVLQMRAIVGKLKARTPLLVSQIDSLELSPDWNVPSGIAYRDIVPDMEASPDALKNKGLELVVGYGASMRALPLTELDFERLYRGPSPQQRFWQAPGPRNPLGQLKFNFPNAYQVYMHGTPSAGLFNKPVRDLSSGCIRIEYPDQLAKRLFGLAGGDKGAASVSRLEREIAKGKNRVLSLPSPVPVYTTYWTAWLDDDGQVQFRDDLYGHDTDDEKELSVTQQPRVAGP